MAALLVALVLLLARGGGGKETEEEVRIEVMGVMEVVNLRYFRFCVGCPQGRRVCLWQW